MNSLRSYFCIETGTAGTDDADDARPDRSAGDAMHCIRELAQLLSTVVLTSMLDISTDG